jgi:hypothetical protein
MPTSPIIKGAHKTANKKEFLYIAVKTHAIQSVKIIIAYILEVVSF